MPVTFPTRYGGPTLADLGEKGAIAAILRAAPSARNGDDAAVLGHPVPNTRTVVTTDMLVGNRHFRLDWSSAHDIGRKAIVANFADIEAMGARPVAALLALGAPAATPVSFVEELAHGIAEEAAKHNAELVGGDLVESEELIISITATGQLGGNLPATTLSKARVGQKVVASGALGESAAGLALLSELGPAGIPEEFRHLVRSHCTPELQPKRGVIARATGATAMTDTSDSLYTDCHAIAYHSGVGINLFGTAIAPSAAMRRAAELLDRDPWEWVLGGGEDHAIIATTAGEAPSGFRVIGEVVRGRAPYPVTVDGETARFADGWSTFSSRPADRHSP
ncbi:MULTISPECIES: thiamine-phosphate kinase [Corynebacterium]|uniref:thiamine-phosphate kinase n=1 Tax=Corynebacterium TaxID=1716 RepID=UPI00124C5CD2|nr:MULTISPECIES: thiamine-phosphate kinase [Corynebacterium]